MRYTKEQRKVIILGEEKVKRAKEICKEVKTFFSNSKGKKLFDNFKLGEQQIVNSILYYGVISVTDAREYGTSFRRSGSFRTLRGRINKNLDKFYCDGKLQQPITIEKLTKKGKGKLYGFWIKGPKVKDLSTLLCDREIEDLESEYDIQFDTMFNYKNPEFTKVAGMSHEECEKNFKDEQYYIGIDCNWNHIYAEQDVRRKACISKVFRSLASRYRNCFIIGDLGQGKSTLMRRIAYDYRTIFDVLELEDVNFDNNSIIFAYNVLKTLSRRSDKRILLLAENLVNKKKWEDFLEKLLGLDKIYVLSTCREGDWDIVEKLSRLKSKIYSVYIDLDYETADAIYKNLKNEKKVLHPEIDKDTLWKQSQRKLMEFLALVYEGKHLDVLLKREIQKLSPNCLKVLRYVSTAHCYLGISLGFAAIKQLTNINEIELSQALALLVGAFLKKKSDAYTGLHELRSKIASEAIHLNLPLEITLTELLGGLSPTFVKKVKYSLHHNPKIDLTFQLFDSIGQVLSTNEFVKILNLEHESEITPDEKVEILKKAKHFIKRCSIEDIFLLLHSFKFVVVKQSMQKELLTILNDEIPPKFQKFKYRKAIPEFHSYALATLEILLKLKEDEMSNSFFNSLIKTSIIKKTIDSINKNTWQDYVNSWGLKEKEWLPISHYIGCVIGLLLLFLDKGLIKIEALKKVVKSTRVIIREFSSHEMDGLFFASNYVKEYITKKTYNDFLDLIFKKLVKCLMSSKHTEETKTMLIEAVSIYNVDIAKKLCKKFKTHFDYKEIPGERKLRIKSRNQETYEKPYDKMLKISEETPLFKTTSDKAKRMCEWYILNAPPIKLQEEVKRYRELGTTGMWWHDFKEIEDVLNEVGKDTILEEDEFLKVLKLSGDLKVRDTLSTKFTIRLELCTALIKKFVNTAKSSDEATYFSYFCTVFREHAEEYYNYFNYFYYPIVDKELLLEKCKIDYKRDYPRLFS